MSLYKRLLSDNYTEDPEAPQGGWVKIPLDPYCAAVYEQRAGAITRTDVMGYFGLNTEEANDHDDVMVRVNAGVSPLAIDTMRHTLALAEQDHLYQSEGALKIRWGLV